MMSIKKISFFSLLIIILVYTCFPFYWAVVSALKKTGTGNFTVEYWPKQPTLENFFYVLSRPAFGSTFFNSVFVSTLTVLFCLVIALTAAYALGRIKFRGRTGLLMAILGTSMFPQVAILSGMFELTRSLGVYNTYQGLIMSYVVFSLPFTVWILTSFIRDLPMEIEEAAMVDGASSFVILFKVFLPLMWPAIATTAILAFIGAWNEFLFALTLTISPEVTTLPVYISRFRGESEHEIPWPNIMAASVLITIPLLIVVLFFQNRIVKGLTAGAVKG
jgi:trehalose/maltose transport system permease protein|tara:strand:+ start:785 stop:1612 length:828 start_codon:yes stop_codon:yes gene_type:complete